MENLNVKNKFDNASKDSVTERYIWRRECARMVSELVKPNANDIVLDIGCGIGKQIIELSDYIKSGIGIDINDGLVEQATINSIYENKENVEFYKGTFDKPDMIVNLKERQLTKIISNYSFHHLNAQEKKKAIEKMIEMGGQSLQTIIIGDLMLFETPYCFKDEFSIIEFGPESEKLSTIEELISCFTNFSFNFVVHQLHPLVGILEVNIDVAKA